MTRHEHLAWAKARALEYVEAGNWATALAAIFSDLGKHDKLRTHPGIRLAQTLMADGRLCDSDRVRKFILGLD